MYEVWECVVLMDKIAEWLAELGHRDEMRRQCRELQRELLAGTISDDRRKQLGKLWKYLSTHPPPRGQFA